MKQKNILRDTHSLKQNNTIRVSPCMKQKSHLRVKMNRGIKELGTSHESNETKWKTTRQVILKQMSVIRVITNMKQIISLRVSKCQCIKQSRYESNAL